MHKPYQKLTFKNGLRLVTVPMENTKAVTVLVLVGTGSKYETKEINGISHFLEHMFFKGTQKRPNTLAIAEELDKVGGNYNAFTDTEMTGYWAKVDSRHADLAIDWVSDIFLNSKLDAREIEKEEKARPRIRRPLCCPTHKVAIRAASRGPLRRSAGLAPPKSRRFCRRAGHAAQSPSSWPPAWRRRHPP